MPQINLQLLAILSYIAPALIAIILAPAYGYQFSFNGKAIIATSIFATLLGYIASGLFRPRNYRAIQLDIKTSSAAAIFLMTIGIAAIVLNFHATQSVPLLNQGMGRLAMSTSPLWNVYIFCGIGLFIYASTINRPGKSSRLSSALAIAYVLLALASAWKGTALYFVFLFAAPLLRNRRIRMKYLLVAGATFTILFFGINGMRSANNSFGDLINQPVYYAIWGFVNFDAEVIGHLSDCLHTIPGFGCRFEVPNATLIIPAFNTYSALAPIYLDGGALLVFVVFFSMALMLGVTARRRDSLINNYVFFLCVYFFFMSHNGYMFYSKTYLVALAFFATLSALLTLVHAEKRQLIRQRANQAST